MYFQIVDNSKKCKKMYAGGDLLDFQEEPGLTGTWKHSLHLKNIENIKYAYVRSSGKGLPELCPDHYKKDWARISSRISSIVKSIKTSKCDLNNNCIYDFIPYNFLMSYLEIKEEIISHAFENIDSPPCHEILRKAHILTEEMNSHTNLYKGIFGRTNYGIFGTKTGRLSNAKSSIPVLTMKKEDRIHLEPTNDLFVEFDFNAAELRTLLALSGKRQPEEDIHDWNLRRIADKSATREDMKKRTFAWLYNPEARDSALESTYDRSWVKDNYWNGASVRTPFLRAFGADSRRALNYIVQSTSSDVCIEQAYKLREFFKDSKTKVCYLLHDSVILDYDKDDVDKFTQAREMFADTRFGEYRVNASIGRNFGQMRSV